MSARTASLTEPSTLTAEWPPVSRTSQDIDTPIWAMDELPAPYREVMTRMAELRAEARKYEELAAVLWTTGATLAHATQALFTEMKFETNLEEGQAGWQLTVPLDGQRRLLFEIVGQPSAIDRKAPSITELLQLLQERAGEQDRLVLAVNAWCDTPPDRRSDAVTPDAVKLVNRLGTNVVTTSTLFNIWKYSLTDPDGARKTLNQLYAQEGGVFK